MEIKIFNGLKKIFGKFSKRRAGALGLGALMTISGGAFAEDAPKPEEIVANGEDVAAIVQTADYVSVEPKIIPAAAEEDTFNIDQPRAGATTHLLSGETLEKAFAAVGVEPTKLGKRRFPSYFVTINGKNYVYHSAEKPTDIRIFESERGKMACRFYASTDDLSQIDSIMIVIGGDGLRTQGLDESNVDLGPNALLISCYSGNRDVNMNDCADVYADMALFADYVFAHDKEIVCNSIIGTSEGGQAVFSTVARNPGIFSAAVCSNGSAYWESGKYPVVGKFAPPRDEFGRIKEGKDVDPLENYKHFQGMDVIFLESTMNNHWPDSIVLTVRDLLAHGVPASDICFMTNDQKLRERITDLIGNGANYHFLTAEEAKERGLWTRHGDGPAMINKSGVLPYLSSPKYTMKNGIKNPSIARRIAHVN